MPGKVVPVVEGKTALVRRPEVPRAIHPKMTVSLSEAGDMAEFQHDVAVAEFEYEAAAELTKAPWFEVPMLSHNATVVELEHETPAVEVME